MKASGRGTTERGRPIGLQGSGLTGVRGLRNALGHGIDALGWESLGWKLSRAVFARFRVSRGPDAPELSASERNFGRFIRTWLLRAADPAVPEWMEVSPEARAIAARFLREVESAQPGTKPVGRVVRITNLGSFRHRVTVDRWEQNEYP